VSAGRNDLRTVAKENRLAMTLWLRRVHLFLAWAFVVGVLLQVFFIGRFLFARESIDAHLSLGYTLPLLALLSVLSAFPARLSRGTVGLAGLVFVLTVVQTILPTLKSTLPPVAALHPVNALLIFWFAVQVARGSSRPAPRAASTASSTMAAR
jgi:hypothetical protein